MASDLQQKLLIQLEELDEQYQQYLTCIKFFKVKEDPNVTIIYSSLRNSFKKLLAG